MNYYRLQPEVAGGWGPATMINPHNPDEILTFEYLFDGWLGDELLTSHPCFIITASLAQQIESAHLSGYILDQLIISTSDLFEDLYSQRQLPNFVWLKIHGVVGKDDFCLTSNGDLIVSEPALIVLQDANLNHCDITSYQGE